MSTRNTVLAKISIDDKTAQGFNSYARNAERAKKTSEAFRKQAIDKITVGLKAQEIGLKKTGKEIDLLTAFYNGATQAQLKNISSLHDSIDAHKREAIATEEAAKQAKMKAQADQKASDLTARVIKELHMEANAASMTEDQMQILRLETQGLSKAQIAQVMHTQALTAEMRDQGKAAMMANGGLRLMRGGMGQLGHQVQDIAVQLQMGQNALLIFGQQGGQIASLFGQNGAMFGAILAVGAALGTYFMPKVFSSKDALEELKKTAEETSKILDVDFLNATANLTEEFAKLSAESKDLAESRIRLALVTAIEAASEAMDQFKDSASDLKFSDMEQGINHTADALSVMSGRLNINRDEAEKLQKMYFDLSTGGDEAAVALAAFTQELVLARDASEEENFALIKINATLQETVDAVKRSTTTQNLYLDAIDGTIDVKKEENDVVDESIEKAADIKKALDDVVEGYHKQLIELELGEEALIRYNLAQQGATESQINAIMALRQRVVDQQEANQALDDAKVKEQELADSKADFVAGVVAQAAALGKSNLELLQNNDLVSQLDVTQKAAFDNAVVRLQEFQDAQDNASRRQRVGSNIDSIRQGLMSEEELLLQSHQKKLADLDEAMLLEDTAIADHQAIRLKLIEDFEKKIADVRKKNGKQEILQGSELTGHMLDQLGKQFAGVQATNRKMFAAQKAYKIANAIQNTYDAANNALSAPYPWPMPQVFAATAVAAGLANVAAIKSTSFDGGGFTGMGARSGGVDGKGGFPAILHPNETVIDHTKGQSGGVTIVNNIDATGADANVDMKIREAVQLGSQQTVATIQDLMSRNRFV